MGRKTICFRKVLIESFSKSITLWGLWFLWEKLRGQTIDEIPDISDLISQVSDLAWIPSTLYPRNFFWISHSPYKVILFEKYMINAFRKHIVFLRANVSGRNCDGLKMTIFVEMGAWPSRDLRDPRKKRPFLRSKSVFPLHALKPLQIWAETVQGSWRTVDLKRDHKREKSGK